ISAVPEKPSKKTPRRMAVLFFSLTRRRGGPPQRAKPGRDDALIGDLAVQQTNRAGVTVHLGDESGRERGIVIRQVATDEFGDERRLEGREELAPDVARPLRVLSQRRLGSDTG